MSQGTIETGKTKAVYAFSDKEPEIIKSQQFQASKYSPARGDILAKVIKMKPGETAYFEARFSGPGASKARSGMKSSILKFMEVNVVDKLDFDRKRDIIFGFYPNQEHDLALVITLRRK
jgi:hypothetical protein